MVGGPAQYGATALTLRCTKGDGKPGVSRCMPGAGFSLWRPGRPRLTGQPSSRTGENPPYGMSGGIEETSASCEARSAPRSYPTIRPSFNVIDWIRLAAFLCHAKGAEPHGFRVDAVSLSLQPGFDGRLSLGGLFSLAG